MCVLNVNPNSVASMARLGSTGLSFYVSNRCRGPVMADFFLLSPLNHYFKLLGSTVVAILIFHYSYPEDPDPIVGSGADISFITECNRSAMWWSNCDSIWHVFFFFSCWCTAHIID